MKKLFLFTAAFLVMTANAQTYLVYFSGSGASTTVSTVKVENLRTGSTLTLDGSDILRLNVTTGINSKEYSPEPFIRIFPNPVTENSTMEIYAPEKGNAIISLLDLTGRPVAQIQCILGNVSQGFRLSGIKKGIYIISVKGTDYQFSEKLVSNGNSIGHSTIEKIGNYPQTTKEKKAEVFNKGTLAPVDMAYYSGDWLKFTGMSGNYSTVKTDLPTSGKTITFNFTGCTDGDGNNYQVVQIGTQTWMGENLKTTKYNDGTNIPLVTDPVAWLNLTNPGYCWYNNDISNKPSYGAIYNFYAVSTGKICPSGWHVPLDSEWSVLTDYLGGSTVAGNKLKDSGTDYWQSTSAMTTNESGFTALPGGDRYITSNGGYIFYDLSYSAVFWTGTYNFSRRINSTSSEIFRVAFGNNASGFSIRCLKD
jgi:uncharacterized protein (TIGR02145 family)